MEKNLLEVNKVVMDLIQTSQLDNNFKEDFILNPQISIESKLGKKINFPKNVSIFVEDQSNPSIIFLNIPREPELEDFELTEEDLEKVAGGSTPLCYIGGALVVGACIYGVGYLCGRYL
jgi:hypothetical protein